MSKQKKILVFSFVFVLVLAIPLYLVISTENLLAADKEHVYKFRMRPIDPHDMMRGKYIRLTYDMGEVNMRDTNQNLRMGDQVYVTVKRDTAGYAYFEYAHHEQPKSSNYFTTRVQYVTLASRGILRLRAIQVDVPFNRYYLNEDYAKQAEDSYRSMTREEDMYAEVVIKDGEYALKEVYVNDIPLPQYLRQNKSKYEAEMKENRRSRPRFRL